MVIIAQANDKVNEPAASLGNVKPIMLNFALEYGRRNWPVIPLWWPLPNGECACRKPGCDGAGKHPIIGNWTSLATTDPQKIEEWWGHWPQANIGILAGETSGILYLDADAKDDGPDNLRDLERKNSPLPDTPINHTGGMGEGIVLKYPKGMKILNKVRFYDGLDTRSNGGQFVAPPSLHPSGRRYEWDALYNPDETELAECPEWLLKLMVGAGQNKPQPNPDQPIPEGSRNNTLTSLAGKMRRNGFGKDAILAALLAENNKRCIPPLDDSEVQRIAQSVSKYTPKAESVPPDDSSSEVLIPKPYKVLNNTLIKINRKIVKGEEIVTEVTVSRIAPKLIKELSNIERNIVHYEVTWKDRGREKHEIVPASTLATKKDLLTLADSGLPVNDLNYKHLIDYFDKFLIVNQLEQCQMVERLGHIKSIFIHPLDAHGLEIVPSDLGEKQLLEAFATKGSVETWKTQVFDKIKTHPKTLFLVLSSFTSVILQDLKVSPFIIDLSGSTSQGKTTALQVARSVWGTEGLINEWNATRVSIERKAGFLNSFPLYMDDTRKADERLLQSIIYQFSGGRAKGRGSLTGSQRELTWNNILFSTGEVSLADYASRAGGAAARAIPLTDQPFNAVTPRFFSEIYKAIEENYGAIGLEFLKRWQKQKGKLVPEFYKYKEHYVRKSMGNEVLTRLSMYYAAVHFTGAALRNIFQLDIDLRQLDQLFSEIAEENKALDKPKELLEEILLKLDASRDDIHYSVTPKEIKAIYHFDTVCLMPNFLKDYLGAEEKMIRREWLKRGFTAVFRDGGKDVDYKSIKKSNKTFRVVVVNKDFVQEMRLDFAEETF